jgi:hypothetical protein
MGGPTNAPARRAARKKAAGETKPRPPLPLVRDGKVIEAPADQDTLTARYTEEAVKFITANQGRPLFPLLAAHRRPRPPPSRRRL